MTDQTKGDVQIYQYFSECLKSFRKKMLIICKIANAGNEQVNNQHQSSLKQLIKENEIILEKFEQILQMCKNFQPIFSRFLLRVRQSVHNFSLKTTSPNILSYLTFLEKIIKQFNNQSQPIALLKIILIKIPKNVGLNSSSQKINQNRISSIKNLTPTEVKNQNVNTKRKDNTHFDSYDKYLEALDRQYRLFDCLNIDQFHYRRTFFLGLQDLRRKDNNLLQDMMDRNKFVKQSLDLYQKCYDNNRKKLMEKKEKVIRNQTQFNLGELKNKQISSNILGQIKQRINPISPASLITKARRLKTDYTNGNQKPSLRQGSINLNTLNNFKNVYKSQQFSNDHKMDKPKQCLQINIDEHGSNSSFIQNDFFLKTKIFEGQRQKVGRNAHMIPLKKVQFIGARIQLVPQYIQKKNLVINEQQRKKKIYNRTQDHVKKKISFITQTKIQRNSTFKMDSPSPSKNTSKFNSIHINHCRIEQ